LSSPPSHRSDPRDPSGFLILADRGQDQATRLDPDRHHLASLKPRLSQPLAGQVQHLCTAIQVAAQAEGRASGVRRLWPAGVAQGVAGGRGAVLQL